MFIKIDALKESKRPKSLDEYSKEKKEDRRHFQIKVFAKY